MNGVMRHLCRAALPGADGVTDGRLLDDFRARQDEAAFAALLRRHGPMVLGVCRRVLQNAADAEDAFQATFLVLARKAASIRTQAVGNWLYGVAYRTAMKAKVMTAKRRVKERQAGQRPQPEPGEDWQEFLPVLDRELSRLPERYRAPVVLCELEGKSRKEAAGQLGLPEGTLSSRLARGKALLARRLGGLASAVGVLAVARAASAGVPAGLLGSTVAAATGWPPARVAALSAGVLKVMLLDKLLHRTAWLLALALIGLGAAASAYPTGEGKGGVAPKKMAGGGTAADKALLPLAGTWECVSMIVDGRTIDIPEGMRSRWSIQGKHFTYEHEGRLLGKGTLKADPTQKPKALDVTYTEGPKIPAEVGIVFPWIYEIYDFAGDELRICYGKPGEPRPAEFAAGPDSNRVLFTYRRVKPADAQDDAVRKELKRLEGTWEITDHLFNGKKEGPGGPTMRLTIQGDTLKAERKGVLAVSGTIKLDPGKNPKTLDFTPTGGPGKNGPRALMLYELKGDELRLCEQRPDGKGTALPRPTEFSAGPGSGRSITILRRVKPQE